MPSASAISRMEVASYPRAVNNSRATRWMAALVPDPDRRIPPSPGSVMPYSLPRGSLNYLPVGRHNRVRPRGENQMSGYKVVRDYPYPIDEVWAVMTEPENV